MTVKKSKLTNEDGSGPLASPAGRPLDPVEGSSPIALRTVINYTPEEQAARDSEPVLAPSPIPYFDVIGRIFGMVTQGRPIGDVISKEEVFFLCTEAQRLFLSQPAMLELNGPVHVVGDTHGQLADCIRIFGRFGIPPDSNYLFLGDYVDHGQQSVENILLLLANKLLWPENFFLLRGHHESVLVNRQHGFKEHCIAHFGSFRLFMAFQDVFNVMPLSALIGGRILCAHGGISPKLESLQDLLDIPRPMIPQTPAEIHSLIDGPQKRLTAIAHDILWSDPVYDLMSGFEDFMTGTSGFAYGIALANVREKLGLDLVVRGHLPVEGGYEFFFDRRRVGVASSFQLTLFSAPNFMGVRDNEAGVLFVSDDMRCRAEAFKP